MTYSARDDIFKRLQGTGSAVAVDELVVTDILGLAHRQLAADPSLSAKAAVAACFTE